MTKIEMQGFKSFAKRVEVLFDGKITSIIGPNGSGKSNIADAVRWVLGEQSAKSLRGGKMEDVIFHGADGAKAQGFCEVALTFDNSDRALPLDFEEISIMRRVYRSGESEYLINRNACRLRDIVDLFRDTGVGKEGYSIIGQGRVDEILSGKSDERRIVFEEAAGISKYKSRKEEAERKLAKTQENLQRIEDILEEIGGQLGPLETQSESAKEYLRLRDEIKEIEVNVFLMRYDQLKDQIVNYRLSGDQLEQQAKEEENRLQKLNEDLDQLSTLLEAIETEAEEHRQNIADFRLMAEKRSARIQLLEQEIGHKEHQNQTDETEILRSKSRRQELQELLELSQNSAQEQDASLNLYREDIEKLSAKLAFQEGEIEQKESELERQKAAIMEAMNQIASARVEESRLQTLINSLTERLQQLEKDSAKSKEEIEKISSEQREENTAKEALEAEALLLQTNIEELDESLLKLTKELEEKEQNKAQVRQTLESAETKLRVLSDMKESYEGYYASVRKLMQDVEKDRTLGQGIVGVVAELIQVPKEYETAVETALGSVMQQIVTENEQDAKRAIEHLRKRQYGRATFLPLSNIKARTLNPKEKESLSREGCFGVASDLIEFAPRYAELMNNLLGRTVICDHLQTAIAIARQNGHAFRIVTLQGDIMNPGGSMSGGSVQKNNHNLLGRSRQIAELQTVTEKGKKSFENLQQEIKNLKTKQEGENLEREGLAQQRHALEVSAIRQGEKLDMLEKLASQYSEQFQSIEEEKQRIKENKLDIEGQLQRSGEEQNQMNQGQALSQEEVAKEQTKLFEMRQLREEELAKLNEWKLRQLSLEKEVLSAQEKQLRFDQERERLSETEKRLDGQIAERKENIEQSKAEIQKIREEDNAEEARLSEMQNRLEALREKQQVEREHKSELEKSVNQAREKQQDIIDRRHKNEMLRSKAELDFENAQQRIWDEYELSYEGAKALKTEIVLSEAEPRLQRQKQKMRALGPVNLQAIDDYKSLKTRYDEMSLQQEDLEKARQDLKTLIAELLDNMQERFLEQFEKINDYFSETFVELFGGGSAQLRLSDPADALNCDIEIIAQPPGKKLQLLSLLSGGERALTAIALLFSMLKLKPTPFCVLDEIEASLDEANVDNFAHYLKRYSDKTQFILITHRKGSMAVSDLLYGVAMGGKGVSKVVSVKLEDYMEEGA